MLEKTFKAFEPSYKKQWDELPVDYKEKLLKGIVIFEIKVLKFEGKFKLNQNKSEKDRRNVSDYLKSKKDKISNELSVYMKEELMNHIKH